MIVRLSQKLATKLRVRVSQALPADPNPLADWSANAFTADRTGYIILTNTASLYSTVMYARGASSDGQFLARALSCLHEFMADDGQEFVYQRFVAPTTATVNFSKALNRSVTGSMNDLVFHAKFQLVERDHSPHEVSFLLNDVPFSSLDYQKPREVFCSLVGGRWAPDGDDA